MPKPNETEWATIGKVVAPFGIHGELKIISYTDIPNRFAELKTVHLGPERTNYQIKSARPYKGEMMVLKLAGIEDVNTAEILRNQELVIPLTQLAKLPPDSYYQHDLIGLRVVTLEGRVVGEIVDIIVTGSNDVYVIKAETGGKEILVPAIKDVVKQVDLMGKMMYIELIKGLLDDDELTTKDEEEEEYTVETEDN